MVVAFEHRGLYAMRNERNVMKKGGHQSERTVWKRNMGNSIRILVTDAALV